MQTKNRSAAIDAVRILGIVAIVAGHVWDNAVTRHLAFTWHVPLFFFLSGYFWRERSLSIEISKRFATLVRPYIAWFTIIGVAYVAWLIADHNVTPGTLGRPVWGGALAGQPFTTFWFVSVLFFTAVAYRLTSRIPLATKITLAAIGLVAGYTVGDILAKSPLGLGSALPCLSIMMCGTAARHYRQRLGGLYVGLVLVVVSAALVTLGVAEPVDIKLGDYGTPIASLAVSVLIAIGLVLIAESTLASLSGAQTDLINRLAAAGFVVVLLHPTVLWALDTPASGGWVDLALAITLPWTVGLVAATTPIAGWITGVDRQKIAIS